MKTAIAVIIVVVGLAINGNASAQARRIAPAEVLRRTEGVGSIPGALLRDGTVCITWSANPLQCQAIGQIPSVVAAKLTIRDWSFFDGVFDLDSSGSPEIFVEYWPKSNDANCPAEYREKGAEMCNAIALLIYKKCNNSYQLDLTLHAPTLGYRPGARFLDGSPRKAIFETRYGGSSGNGLFYLDWRRRELELITDDYDLEDIDKDSAPAFLKIGGTSAIFIMARGRDRTAKQGAALFGWTGETYQLWWPRWGQRPYVIYAKLIEGTGDKAPEIVAVLDSGADPSEGSNLRELAVYKLKGKTWAAADRITIRATSSLLYPRLDSVSGNAGETIITLDYGDGALSRFEYDRGKIKSAARAGTAAAAQSSR